MLQETSAQTKNPLKSFAQFRLLTELSLKLQSLFNSENIHSEIVTVVQNKFHYHSFSIWSVSADGTATLRAHSGAYNKYLRPGFTMKNEGIVATVIKTKKTYVCNDVSKDPHFTSLSFPVETKSQMTIPVLVDGVVIAALTVESHIPGAFDDDDRMTFESLGAQLSVSFTNQNLYGEIKSFNKKLQQTVEERTQELRNAQDRILDQQRLLQKENRALKNIVNHEIRNEGFIIGEGSAIKSVINMVDKIAPTNATVLIQGESGTGKELIARRLHFKSERQQKPYVTINCGALQETLLESELFGHEKGSFTGAVTQKMGLAETADGGTLFLDEIGELSLAIQAKLLRFLQEGEICRLGGKKAIQVDVRIISATNRDLEKEVKEGRFREDLFYRLNTITLRMPPLRKRKEDIRALADHFLRNSKFGGPIQIKRVDPKVHEVFVNYEWPGNIRELQNTIERIKILAERNEITLEDVPFNIRMPKTGAGDSPGGGAGEFNANLSLDELERQHILRILSFHQGNKTKTAMSLGVTIKTLYNKLHRYGLIKEPGGIRPQ
ncbi:MAG: sigma-54-dependent Fis family transcriptional regulator [Deltaproteobacteria bacterium]|nr:sigma-54-dependent Fis family transcriptional regulator [Deltaproteobacteria bacterium]